MKKLIKVIIAIGLLGNKIIGRFYCHIYASEYHDSLVSLSKNSSKDSTSFRIGIYNIRSMNYSKESLADFLLIIFIKQCGLLMVIMV